MDKCYRKYPRCPRCGQIDGSPGNFLDWSCSNCGISTTRLKFKKQIMRKMKHEMMRRAGAFRIIDGRVAYSD